jgi:hypothetical protein
VIGLAVAANRLVSHQPIIEIFMLGRPLFLWLPRLLWRVTLVASVLLILLVATAPLLDSGKRPWLMLFAKDPTVRRTTLASAIGLLATASIFFRPPDYRAAAERDRRESRRPPLSGAGA